MGYLHPDRRCGRQTGGSGRRPARLRCRSAARAYRRASPVNDMPTSPANGTKPAMAVIAPRARQFRACAHRDTYYFWSGHQFAWRQGPGEFLVLSPTTRRNDETYPDEPPGIAGALRKGKVGTPVPGPSSAPHTLAENCFSGGVATQSGLLPREHTPGPAALAAPAQANRVSADRRPSARPSGASG